MARLLTVLFILCACLVAWPAHADNQAASKRALDLMPWPAHIEMQRGAFRFTKDFKIAVLGHPAERMYGGATRLLHRLGRRTGIFFDQGFVTKKNSNPHAALVIRVHRPGHVKLGEDESYRLHVTDEQVILKAEDDIGALRGLQTLMQLVHSDQSGYYLPAVKIEDHPRFPWRGLMIDVARHFEPVNVIERNLNAMAAVKLNVLHLHLTDDQGFRIQSKTFPKLTGMGSRGQFYTQQQMKRMIKYANDRGIRVVPEFDLPAHATSWFVGYPRYASAPGPYRLKNKACICDPVFDPTKASTYQFLSRFFKEMSALFPDEYIHIGGDENNGVQWRNNRRIQLFIKKHHIKDTAALQTYFIQKLAKIITRDGKKVVGWDEILQPGVPRSAVIQSWRGKKSLYKAAREGHPAILSHGYYLKQHSAAYYYRHDPLPADVHLAPKVKKNILGGEAAKWALFVDPITIDIHTWPATAAIAERLWSPDSLRDTDWMYKRLYAVSLRLEEYGVMHIKNQNMLLRQLAGQRDIRPLKVLVGVIGPLEGNKRLDNKNKPLTLYSPLTSLADAAAADAWTALQFNRLVDRFVQHPDPDLEQDIRSDLMLWKKNAPALSAIIKYSPALHEARPLARSLAKLSRIGLQALNSYDHKQPPAKRWVKRAADTATRARRPAAEVKLHIVDAVMKLARFAAHKEPSKQREEHQQED